MNTTFEQMEEFYNRLSAYMADIKRVEDIWNSRKFFDWSEYPDDKDFSLSGYICKLDFEEEELEMLIYYEKNGEIVDWILI